MNDADDIFRGLFIGATINAVIVLIVFHEDISVELLAVVACIALICFGYTEGK